MSYPTIQLKAGREAATGFHHPWVFSGAIEGLPSSVEPGDLVYVADRRGEIIPPPVKKSAPGGNLPARGQFQRVL